MDGVMQINALNCALALKDVYRKVELKERII